MADTGTLLNGVTAAGNGSAVARTKGLYCFAVNGTFGGSTVSLEMLGPDGTNYIAVSGASFTSAGAVNVELPAGRYRGVVTGGAAMTIYASLKEAGWQSGV